jgi:hypothetical protein
MRYAIDLPNFGDYGDPRLLASLAIQTNFTRHDIYSAAGHDWPMRSLVHPQHLEKHLRLCIVHDDHQLSALLRMKQV